MPSAPTVLLASSAAATAVGVVVIHALVARARRAMPADVEGRTVALARLRKAIVRTVVFAAVAPMATLFLGPVRSAAHVALPAVLPSVLLLPGSGQVGASHPALRERLEALGLAPSPEAP